MSDEPVETLPPLSPRLARLLADENDLPPVDPGRRQRITDAVEATIGAPPGPMPHAGSGGAGAAGGSSGVLGYVLVGLAGLGVGMAAGAWLHAQWSPAAAPAPSPRAPSSAPAPSGGTDQGVGAAATEPEPIVAPRVPDALPSLERTEAPPSVTRPRPPGPPQRTTLAAEGRVLDAARSAILRGHPEEALQAAERHAQEHPAGALAEEREVLAVRALVALDRAAEARARADRFRASFPASAMLPAIDRALASGQEGRSP